MGHPRRISHSMADPHPLKLALIEFKGFGPVTCRKLQERGIVTALDLLLHRPHRYEDRRRIVDIGEIDNGGSFTVVAQIRSVTSGWGKAPVTAQVVDGSARLGAVWFNRPYLRRQVHPEVDYVVHGKVREHGGALQFYNPSLERLEEGAEPRCIVPVYPALGELGPARVRTLMRKLLPQLDLHDLPDPLDEEVRSRYGLASLGEALASIHDPGIEPGALKATERRGAASRRLAFGELLALQVRLQRRRQARAVVTTERSYAALGEAAERLASLLPFELTGAQERVLAEVRKDLADDAPMSRLLQGDVGCGKTAVALGAILPVIDSGWQSALMAPTEILAEQHYLSLQQWLPKDIDVELFTGSRSLERARDRLRRGQVQLAVGTHALIQERTEFHNLGLVVVDEQHRFGVEQRRALVDKGSQPDLLVMTATPIPRSLTLALYGDLDLSVIDELPAGREPIVTEVLAAADHQRVVEAVSQELAEDGRVFVVFPSIEADGERTAPSLEQEGIAWMERLHDYRCAVLSGRTPAEERAEVLRRFGEGEAPVLLTTSVIEVGIDVPAAGLLVIDGADWFGLSQLHQLRGRIGRGDRGGRCLALLRQTSETASERLEIFSASSDGFEIADADLRLRGPGELLGVQQAGIPNLRAASLVHDVDLLEAARVEARRIEGLSE